jgi:hypothetical protein
MRILRSLSRRGSSVDTAGWFTVLRTYNWFATSQLPGSFRDKSRRVAKSIAGREAPSGTDFHGASVSLQMTDLRFQDARLIRAALIILGAMAITSILLWWIMHP